MPLHLEGYSEEQQMLEESRHWGLQGRPGGNVTACWRHALKWGGGQAGGQLGGPRGSSSCGLHTFHYFLLSSSYGLPEPSGPASQST